MNADFETRQRAAFTKKIISDAEGIAGSSESDPSAWSGSVSL